MKKSVLSIMMALCILVTMLPVQVFATGAIAAGSCGPNVSWSLSKDKVLTISGVGPMNDFEGWKNPWKDYLAEITEVVIQEGVTTVGAYSCGFMFSLKKVSLPSTLKEIRNSAFEACLILESVTIPEGVTKIGDNAFVECEAFTEIDIPKSVVSIGNYALCASYLEKIVLHDGVVSIGDGAFLSTRIKEIYIPKTVTSIGENAFNSCRQLKEIKIPEGVKSIGEQAFYYCTALEKINIPSTVTSMGCGVLGYCNSLTSVKLAASNPAYVLEDDVIYSADRTLLHTVLTTKSGSYVIPNTVTTINDYAAIGCEKLTGVTIPTSVTSLGIWSFQSTGLTKVTIPHSIQVLPERAFACCDNLKTVTLPHNLTTIDDEALAFCPSLTKLSIPASVTYMGDCVLRDADSLTYVVFQGDAPAIHRDAFFSTVTKAYYPEGNSTWTSSVRKDYSGTITWSVSPLCRDGHWFGNWTTIHEPNCLTEGIKQTVCETCGLQNTLSIPKTDHHYTESTIPATCTEPGYYSLVCRDCADTQVKDLAPKGHTYRGGICVTCGENEHYYLTGDVSGDGKVDMKDWNMLYAHLCELSVLPKETLTCADVNGDGKVNMKDWNRLYEHVTGVKPLN